MHSCTPAPSATAVGVVIFNTGSSFAIVQLRELVEIVAPLGVLIPNVNCSLPSERKSLIIGTETVLVISPGKKVSTPEVIVKSDGAVALPLTVV